MSKLPLFVIFMVCFITSVYAEPNKTTIMPGADCNVLVQGVEKGEVTINFYSSVCGNSDMALGLEIFLRSANMQRLKILPVDAPTIQLLESFLRKPEVALEFFLKSQTAEAVKWLTQYLAAGLNPNLIIVRPDNRRESLISAALRANNVEAAIALLSNGASPHSFQELWGESDGRPSSLFPIEYLGELSQSDDDLSKLLRAMVGAGLIAPDEQIPRDGYQNLQMDRVHKELAINEKKHLLKIPRANSICDRTRRKICQVSSKRSNYDWCGAQDKLPESISVAPADAGMLYKEFEFIKFIGLVAIQEDKMHVLIYLPKGYHPNYGLAIVSKNVDRIEIYKFMPPTAGLGLCQEILQRRNITSQQNHEDCWRRITFENDGDAGIMKVRNYSTMYLLNKCP